MIRIKKHFAWIIPALIALLILSGCAPQAINPAEKNDAKKASQESITVSIRDFAFNPAVITITKGTEITWVNEDSASHTVASEGSFDSGSLSKGQSFSYTFTEAGTFDYKCSIHTSMKGKVVVE